MIHDPKVVTIIQARMGSNRLPGKVLADLLGEPLIGRMLRRVRRSRRCGELWVATSEEARDDDLAQYISSCGVPVHRGSEHDVLGRYAHVASATEADVVVRLTADCPLIDPEVIDEAIEMLNSTQFDYVSNTLARTYPDGLDVEVMTSAALFAAHGEADAPRLREHVTLYINGKEGGAADRFSRRQMTFRADFSHLRWTVDYEEDLAFVRRVFELLGSQDDAGWLEIVALITKHPDLYGLQIAASEAAKVRLA